MKKAIAILLMAIVALGCVFAEDLASSKTLTLDYKMGTTSKLAWTDDAEKVASLSAAETISDISGTEKSVDLSTASTYYAVLVTNYPGAATLNVACSSFKNQDVSDSYITTNYTFDDASDSKTASEATTVDADKDLESGTAKRYIYMPVSVIADPTSLEAAVAGTYKATLVATVSAN